MKENSFRLYFYKVIDGCNKGNKSWLQRENTSGGAAGLIEN